MKRKISNGSLLGLGLAALVTQVLTGSASAVGIDQSNTAQQSAPTPTVPLALQVTVSENRFTLSADRADVQKLLKELFDRANRQVSIDQSVAGPVTLSLKSQPFDTVLNVICNQAHLTHRYDMATHIYIITWQPRALQTGYATFNFLNANVPGQLSQMGYSNLYGYPVTNNLVPPELTITTLPQAASTAGPAAQNSAGGREAHARVRVAPQGPAGDMGVLDAHLAARRGFGGSGGFGGGQQRSGPTGLSRATSLQAQQPPGIELMRLVSVDIPHAQPEPVADVLRRVAAQAGVKLVVDAAVPQDSRLRMSGRVSPRPLRAALDALALAAHLRWQWAGDHVEVLAAPDLPSYMQQLSGGSRAAGLAPGAQSKSPTVPR